MSEQLLALMEQAFSAMDEVCSGLDGDEWDRPTDLPGWSVKDNLSHVCGIEAWILGRPRAEGEPPRAPHVKNELGAMNELEVAARRGRAPKEILEEYRELVAERLKTLATLSPEEWKTESWTPLGQAPVERMIATRVIDVFFHEQDVRRAVGRSGHMNGDVARHTFERMAGLMPMVVAKRAGASDGSAVTFEVGAPGRSFTVSVEGGRGALAGELASEPTARLAMDLETFLCLTGGRWSPERALSGGRVSVSGDPKLAEKILQNVNIMI